MNKETKYVLLFFFFMPYILCGSLGILSLGVAGLNGLISKTDQAQAYDTCVHSHLDELIIATTTTTFQNILKVCPKSPYINFLT